MCGGITQPRLPGGASQCILAGRRKHSLEGVCSIRQLTIWSLLGDKCAKQTGGLVRGISDQWCTKVLTEGSEAPPVAPPLSPLVY